MSMTNEITALVPRYKRGLRKGRGESSGHGKTSGRGTKGAGARQGGPHWKTGHEGGQTPLHRRLPARGFSNNNFERNWYIVNVQDLEAGFPDGATIDASALIQAHLVPDAKLPVKVLGDGALTHKLTIQVGWYSKSAFEKITAAGGTALNAKGEPFAFPKPKKKFVKRDDKQGKKAAKAEGAAKPEAPKAESPKAEAPKAEAPKGEAAAPAPDAPQA
jgi:large subunit ribosomal protein L15